MVAAQSQQPQQQLANKTSTTAAGPVPGPVVTQQQQQDEGEEPAKHQHAGPATPAPPCPQQQGVLHFNWEQRSQARACMQTLVLALADDPVNSYFSGSRRRRFVKDEVKGYLKALRCATNFIATPDSCAVALWQLLPQETPRNELWAGWTRILRVPPRLWRQLLRLELHYESAHAALAAAVGSYYYLSFIGTRPEARGRGLGGALLAHITRRADTEGRWCLLEATSPASQALYARHGFVTYEAFRVSPAAPPVFLMKRPPAPAAAAPAAAPAVAVAEPAAPAAAAAVVVADEAAAGVLSLAEALAAKLAAAGAAGKAAGPGSECGSDHSALIGTLAAAEEAAGHDEQQQQVLLRLEEEAAGSSSSSSSSSSSEDEQESDGEEQEAAHAGAASAAVGAAAVISGDAGVLVRSNSSVARGLKELGEAAAGAAAAVAATTASSSVGRVGSSSRAGAGGPIADGCC